MQNSEEQQIIPPPEPQSPNPKHKFWGKVFLALVLVAAVFLVYHFRYGGTYLWIIDSYEDCVAVGYPTLESQPPSCRTPNGKATFTKELDPMTFWQTYRNEEYGYTVKYPPHWTIHKIGGLYGEVNILPPNPEDFVEYVSIAEDPRPLELIRKVHSESKGPVFTEKVINFAGVTSYQYTTDKEVTPGGLSVYIPYKDKIYLLSTSKYDLREVELILDTFEFIDQDFIFSNWQTYRNEEYGLEFRYPGDFEEMFGFEDKFFVRNVRNDTIISFGVYLEQSILGAEGVRPTAQSGIKKYVIDGKEMTVYVMEDTLPGLIEPRKYILVSVNKYNQPLWIIATFPIKNPESENLIDQMFSTFRFIKSDPTASWKIFKDEQGRFEIKYPDYVYLDFSPEYEAGIRRDRVFGVNDVGSGGSTFYFSIYAKPVRPVDEVAMCREAGGFYIRAYDTSQKIKIDGIDYTKCTFYREPQDDHVLHVVFNKGGHTYQILATQYDKNDVLIDQILSTFKFTQ